MQAFFWISIGIVFYTYIGYGLLLFLFNYVTKRNQNIDEEHLPLVTFIVPAYNEEKTIHEKIENCLAFNYPKEKIFLVFTADGCTDKTVEIIRSHPAVKLLHHEERLGKSEAINRAMAQVDTPVVVFSDANVMLHPDCIRKLVRHYNDKEVGGVSGEKRIEATSNTVGIGEKLYWQYESLLKKANADFYTIVGAAGELFSIRTHLFRPLQQHIILDDFVISANVCLQGFRFLYEKEAFGIETSSASIGEEGKRKIRISAGCFQAFFSLPALLNPFKNIRVMFQYFSHRVLRWIICPLLIPLILLLNVQLVLSGGDQIFTTLLFLQGLFYVWVLAGWLFSYKKTPVPFLFIPYYFVFMILSQYAGFFRFVQNQQTVFWEKAARQPSN